MNYTLEVNSTQKEEILVSVLVPNAENFAISGGDLSENTVYSFRIHVTNNVGVVSTNEREFCKSLFAAKFIFTMSYNIIDTTDVQVVTATTIEGENTTAIQCEFIRGSAAAGCMVVLTSENNQEEHHNLTRNPDIYCSILVVMLEHPQSHYDGVEGFDIESDGSVGSLAVPGQFRNTLLTPCSVIMVEPSKF